VRRMFGIFWKFARIGERLSPYVSICCVVMAVSHENLGWWVKRVGADWIRFRCYGHDDVEGCRGGAGLGNHKNAW
jgi:hypothetical protein